MKCEKCGNSHPDEIMPWGLCPMCWEKFESKTAKTGKRQPTSDLSTNYGVDCRARHLRYCKPPHAAK